VAATPASKTPRWRGIEAVLPANAATGENQDASVDAVSCASAGNCTAAGNYQDTSGLTQGLLLTEKAGKWSRGVEAAVPAGAGPGLVYLASVSCASAGNCAAVSSGGLLLTEKAGKWATGVEATLPGNAAPVDSVLLYSVSCASAGDCTAVGTYETASGWSAGLVLTEQAGRWATGVQATLPSNAGTSGNAVLDSVSCSSAGNCTAVGFYNGYDAGGEGLLLTKKTGTWRRGVTASLPKNAIAGKPVALTSVSCASARNCSAVGTYDNDEGSKDLTTPLGLLLTEKAGKWRTGVQALPPKHSVPRPSQVSLDSVSCASAGDCVAVGAYADGGTSQGILLTEKAGTWRRGLEAALPRNAGAGSRQDVDLLSISCAAPGNCTAVGGYTDHSGADRSLVVTESAGRWATGVAAALPASAGASSNAGLAAVSCASAASCAAAGEYSSGSVGAGLLVDGSGKTCVVPALKRKTLAAAKRSIESHDCSLGEVRRVTSQRVAIGHVISQEPRPGSRLADGAKVDLVVAKGP